VLRAVGATFAAFGLYVLAFAGCVIHSQPARLRLQLPPATLGASISLQQHLAVERDGRINELDAALEIDSERIDLVALAFNQRVLSLHYDGRSLESWRHPALPSELRAEDVLEDLQLTLWPVDALRPALPSGWRIEENGVRRILLAGELPVTEIYYSAEPRWQGKIVVNNLRYRYRLTIYSVLTGQ
jgi:uncharacterized protein DUF3261